MLTLLNDLNDYGTSCDITTSYGTSYGTVAMTGTRFPQSITYYVTGSPVATGDSDTIKSITFHSNITGDWISGPVSYYQDNETVTATTTTGYFTADSHTCWNYHTINVPISARDPLQQLRDIIRSRLSPTIITSRNRKPIDLTADIRETRARQTLRKVVGDDQFFNFLKHGFVSLRAKSGRTYQIFPGHRLTCVYEGGKMVEKLCVVLQGDFPPTDSVIMRYLLLLNDEGRFIKTANRSGPDYPFVVPAIAPQESLPDIFRRIKQVA